MFCPTIVFTTLYLAAERFWWWRIVLPGPALELPKDWRKELFEAQKKATLMFLSERAPSCCSGRWCWAMGGYWVFSLSCLRPSATRCKLMGDRPNFVFVT